jgi:hypothetical protein
MRRCKGVNRGEGCRGQKRGKMERRIGGPEIRNYKTKTTDRRTKGPRKEERRQKKFDIVVGWLERQRLGPKSVEHRT